MKPRTRSATLAWVYGAETTDAVGAVFEAVATNGAWAPALWRLEVANVLERGVRRGRHDAAYRDANLADLALMPIRLDLETDQHAWGATARLDHDDFGLKQSKIIKRERF